MRGGKESHGWRTQLQWRLLTAKVMSMAAPEAVEGLLSPSATNTGPTSTVDTWWGGEKDGSSCLLGERHVCG